MHGRERCHGLCMAAQRAQRPHLAACRLVRAAVGRPELDGAVSGAAGIARGAWWGTGCSTGGQGCGRQLNEGVHGGCVPLLRLADQPLLVPLPVHCRPWRPPPPQAVVEGCCNGWQVPAACCGAGWADEELGLCGHVVGSYTVPAGCERCLTPQLHSVFLAGVMGDFMVVAARALQAHVSHLASLVMRLSVLCQPAGDCWLTPVPARQVLLQLCAPQRVIGGQLLSQGAARPLRVGQTAQREVRANPGPSIRLQIAEASVHAAV